MNSKGNYIGLGSNNMRFVGSDDIQSMYVLTKVLYKDTKSLTSPVIK